MHEPPASCCGSPGLCLPRQPCDVSVPLLPARAGPQDPQRATSESPALPAMPLLVPPRMAVASPMTAHPSHGGSQPAGDGCPRLAAPHSVPLLPAVPSLSLSHGTRLSQEHRGCCLPPVTSSRPSLCPFLLPASLAAPGEVLALGPGQTQGAFCLVFQSLSSRARCTPSAAAGHGGSAPAPCPWLSPPHGPQPLLSPCAVPPGPHADSSCRRDIIRNVNY